MACYLMTDSGPEGKNYFRAKHEEKAGKQTVGGEMVVTGGYVAGDHHRFVLILCGREETAGAHSSMSLRGLLAGDGNI